MNWDLSGFYFGDLDVKGILIPVAASETLKVLNFPVLHPHMGCYERMLERASKIELPTGSPSGLPQQCRAWLGDELSRDTEIWLRSGKRIPQELVGWEELNRPGEAFALPDIRWLSRETEVRASYDGNRHKSS